MTDKSSQSRELRSDKLESRVALLEYQFATQTKMLERIESKQDDVITKVNTLKYVTTHEFDVYTEKANRTFVTNESIKSMRTLFWAIITASVVGLVGLGFFIIESLIKK